MEFCFGPRGPLRVQSGLINRATSLPEGDCFPRSVEAWNPDPASALLFGRSSLPPSPKDFYFVPSGVNLHGFDRESGGFHCAVYSTPCGGKERGERQSTGHHFEAHASVGSLRS